MSDNTKKLYPEVRKFIKEINSKDLEPLYKLTPNEARDFLSQLQSRYYNEITANITDIEIKTEMEGVIPVRLIKPENTNDELLPVIMYAHGGGWVMGDKYTHDELIKKLAINLNCCVAFIEYERSPEAKFPKAFNQIYSVLSSLNKDHTEYGLDNTKIILAGDSAGANIMAAIAIRLNKEKSINPVFQLLLYPALDVNRNTNSYSKFEDGPWLTKKAMKWFWDAYKSKDEDKDSIYFSPFLAVEYDLKGLPETLIITAENDVLRDEGEKFALKLSEAGVKASCVRILGTCHDFMMLNALFDTKPTQTAFDVITGVLGRVLNKD